MFLINKNTVKIQIHDTKTEYKKRKKNEKTEMEK